MTGSRLVKVNPCSIVVEQVRSRLRSEHPADFVVLAVGVESDDSLARELKPGFPRLYTIGDARRAGRIAQAVRDGFDTAWNLQ
ncbi:MAG TPA: hypothetical protein PK545_08645, partial [Deltaproteobacteria bacterium]|nr:hypothetical protein [Deltaproteobacteria bacterium]